MLLLIISIQERCKVGGGNESYFSEKLKWFCPDQE